MATVHCCNVMDESALRGHVQRGKDIISRQVVWLCARVQAATTEREQLMSPAGAYTHDRLGGAARAAGDVTKRQQTKKDLAAFGVEVLVSREIVCFRDRQHDYA